MRHHYKRYQAGVSLIEVLIAMVILAIGLLGLVGLQARLNVLQMESYQRAQALLLLHDMAGRLASNRYNVGDYATGAPLATPLGAGMTCPTATATRVQRDLREWCLALQGAGEAIGTSKVGAMVGGRGCVEDLTGGDYQVTVAWQGLAPLSAPPVLVACGSTLYNGGTGSTCVNDLCRRAVTTTVRIADLDAT
jgi:type IV pilus assembly protein PilV